MLNENKREQPKSPDIKKEKRTLEEWFEYLKTELIKKESSDSKRKEKIDLILQLAREKYQSRLNEKMDLEWAFYQIESACRGQKIDEDIYKEMREIAYSF